MTIILSTPILEVSQKSSNYDWEHGKWTLSQQLQSPISHDVSLGPRKAWNSGSFPKTIMHEVVLLVTKEWPSKKQIFRFTSNLSLSFYQNKASSSTLGMRNLLGQRFNARELEKLGPNYLHLFALSCCRNFFLSSVISPRLNFEMHLESDLGFKRSKLRDVDSYELLERHFTTEIFKIQSPARWFEPELEVSVAN